MTRVAQLWRYPVKSLGGEAVREARFDVRGTHGDRLWAVRDLSSGMTATARRLPALLLARARYASAVPPSAGPGAAPPVILTLPDGSEVGSDDPSVHAQLSAFLDRDVRLTALPPASDTSLHRMSPRQQAASIRRLRVDFGVEPGGRLPDLASLPARDLMLLSRYTTPPGAFVDLAPVHLLTTASLRALADAMGRADLDGRRFRPNVLLAHDGSSFAEAEWTGSTLALGDARLRVRVPTVRCVVPSRPQHDLPLDRALTRALTEHADRFLGVYADVAGSGVVRVGDACAVRADDAASRPRRLAAAATRRSARFAVGLLDRVSAVSGRSLR